MKIAIVPSWYDSPRARSRGSFVRAQAVALMRHGLDVTVVAPDRDLRRPPLSVVEGIEDGVRHLRVALPSPTHRLLGFYAPGVIAVVLRRILDTVGADVVHAHAVRPAGVLVERACAAARTPYVITEHSSPITEFWWTPHGRRQMARAYRDARRIFCVSEALRQDLVRHFDDAVAHATVLPNGIDTDRFVPTSSPRPDSLPTRLLFVGTLEARKGVGDLLLAMTHLPPTVQLTIVGAGPLDDALQAQARGLGLDARVRFAGPARPDEMPAIYRAHDVLAVASRHETFSLVSAEAVASGLIVVATRCGGPEEVVPAAGGLLVPPGDVPALTEALEEVVTGRVRFDPAAARAQIVERFAMSRLVERLALQYEDVRRGR
jgi:glycosyltransferase involved in cell wall biosynthesis